MLTGAQTPVAPVAEVTLVITQHTDGRTTIQGPIHDKPMCYALLECAKDAIREHHGRQNSPIVPPPGIKLL